MAEKAGSRLGVYQPLKKMPKDPPHEFFSRTRNARHVKSMRPSELAVLCYAHYDGRSQIKQSKVRKPQAEVMQRLS